MTRFFCTVVLHIMISGEFKQAFDMMKYALNHPWKFHSWRQAYFVGFTQFFVLLTFEVLNTAILLTTESVMDVIMDFVALAVITSFDDYLFSSESVRNSQLGQLISNRSHVIDQISVELNDFVKVEVTSGSNKSGLKLEPLFKDCKEDTDKMVYANTERPKEP